MLSEGSAIALSSVNNGFKKEKRKKVPALILQFPNPSGNLTKLLFISYYV